jgi:hypothetical protein
VRCADLAGWIFPSGNEDGSCVGGAQQNARGAVAAVVSITFNRVAYLKRHLDSLLAVHGADPDNRFNFLPHLGGGGGAVHWLPRCHVPEIL